MRSWRSPDTNLSFLEPKSEGLIGCKGTGRVSFDLGPVYQLAMGEMDIIHKVIFGLGSWGLGELGGFRVLTEGVPNWELGASVCVGGG